MTPDRYRQLGQLFHAALELESGERAAFLEGACGDDQELRREVESLIAAHQQAGNYFASPALKVAAGLIADQEAQSLAGKCISHYQVLSMLGAGGMGEVYLAQDTRLGRKVALKLLPKKFTQDEVRVKRFDREARAVSALNHPNIITIHAIGWAEERHYIGNEYFEGETLRQRMASGQIELRAVLDIAIQVASALSAAHEVGIVHRDIKPENVMIRRDGLVKMLDFGLAKLIEQQPSASPSGETGDESLETLSAGAITGLIMGTPQYMSPEQIRGGKVEASSDLFSLGIVLYELVAGARPFTGKTPGEVMAAILEKEFLPLVQRAPRIPAELGRIIAKALAKECEKRYQTASDLRIDLRNLHYNLETEPIHRYISCPQCAQDNPASHVYCSKCGASLRKVCSYCGQDVHEGLLFCGRCGHRFSDRTSTREMPGRDLLETQIVAPSEGERRQASVVCSNLAGYPALVEQLAPEELDEVFGKVRSTMVEIVQKHGGVVTQFNGEEMTALFGIPATNEDDFVRAVRAALEFHAQVRELTGELEKRVGHQVRLCTGINTGQVVTQLRSFGQEKYRVTGEALQISAKLAAQAEADEILVSQETRRLFAPFFKTEAGAFLTLKARSAPVMTYRILGESRVQSRLEATQALGLTRYTGRDEELITLQALYEKGIKGEGQFVTIMGEAGAGKSRLLLEFLRSRRESPAIVLQGRCQSYGGNIPYQPFISVLRDVLNLQEGESPTRLMTDAISSVRAIDPNLEIYIPLYLHLLSLQSDEHSLPGHLQGEDLRFAILDALSAIFTLRTKQSPMIMLLEDWHWADEGSEEALKKLVAMAAGYPLIVIVTCRPELSFNRAYLKHHTQLYLGPLDASPSISIMKSILDVDFLPEGLGDLLYRRTGGNPFFIEEVCATLIENGIVRVEDRTATLNGSLEEFNLPDTVQAVIRARLDRLDRETQVVLRHASVIGQEFNRPILERTFESPLNLPRCLDKLQALGLIRQVRVLPEAIYQFNHKLTQEVAYESMLLHQRRSLHEAAGQAIEELSKDRIEERLDLLAIHFSRAENWDKAARYGLEAAERAVKLIRFSEALGMLEKVEGWVLKLPPTNERKETLVKVLLRQERLCETLGYPERQQALINRIISLLDPLTDQARLAEVYIRQGELFTLLKNFTEAERFLNDSLAIRRSLSDRAGERRALRSLGFLSWQQGLYQEALACNRSALEIDQEIEDATGYTQDLSNIGAILRTQGEPEKALAPLEEAIRISGSLGRLDFQVYALGILGNVYRDLGGMTDSAKQYTHAVGILGNVYRDLGAIDKAAECLRRGIEVAKQNRMPMAQMINMRNLAGLCGDQGWVEECLRLYQELLSFVRSLDIKSELAQVLHVYGQRLLEIGSVEEAQTHLLEAAELFSRLGEHEKELLTLTSLARVYEQLADGYEKYLAIWQRIRKIHRERNEPIAGNGPLKKMAGQAREAGDQDSALRYYREALDLAIEKSDAADEGDLLNTMGIIEWERGNYSLSLEHYERARQIFEELEDSHHAGLILNSIGVTLKAMGRLDEAQSRLEEAIQFHRASGERLFEGHALAAMGELLSGLGDWERAADHYRDSLKLRQEVGDRQGEGWMLFHLAKICAAQHLPKRSRDLLNQSLAIADEINNERLKEACINMQRIM